MKINSKILSFTGWVLLLGFLIFSMSFVSIEKNKQVCTKINIKVIDSTEYLFINKNEIKNLITDSNISIIGYNMLKINSLKIKKIINNYPPVKTTNIYYNLKGSINIEITQRKPLLRIINYSGESYYIDKEGIMMQLSNIYTARVIVINGNINEPFESRRTINLKDTIENIRGNTLREVYELATYINNDPFWDDQFQQIYINNDNEYELVPLVGLQKIYFGGIENYKTKLKNLKAFYQQGLSKKGWSTYEQINLKYENQIVCTKKEL
jgi:cell division protein FtsQ